MPDTDGLVVGLTGGIGAGKSTVAKRLAELGAAVIDADRIGHEILARPKVIKEIKATFGGDVLTEEKTVDRRKLGRLVFTDADKRGLLHEIVHPPMEAEFQRLIGEARRQHRIAVLDAAILFEAGWDRLCDVTVCVTAPRPVRLQRLRAARGWNDEQLAARERAQAGIEQKESKAQIVLVNAGSKEECRSSVDRMYQDWLP